MCIVHCHIPVSPRLLRLKKELQIESANNELSVDPEVVHNKKIFSLSRFCGHTCNKRVTKSIAPPPPPPPPRPILGNMARNGVGVALEHIPHFGSLDWAWLTKEEHKPHPLQIYSGLCCWSAQLWTGCGYQQKREHKPHPLSCSTELLSSALLAVMNFWDLACSSEIPSDLTSILTLPLMGLGELHCLVHVETSPLTYTETMGIQNSYQCFF